ncbi:MAG: anti-FecI sigma factor [Prolixibacteraceae bacterium]|nr:MAG: anti-FecI sigma factor [Prolixibacteraceae bacterium]
MKEKKNIEFFNRELLAKYLCNEVNDLEKLEVETWINHSVENREELEQSRKMLDSVDAYYKAGSFNSKFGWENISAIINPTQMKVIQRKNVRKEVVTRFYKYAAIIVFAVLLGSAGYYFGFRNNIIEVYSEIISTPTQVINEYILPDGSVVALNSNSKLVFPKHFKGDTREVTIEGEAFFDVKPNAEKPFVINAGNALVKVIGTTFNVCAYPETETVEVVVETGKVHVLSKYNETITNKNGVFLVPGEKCTFFNKSSVLEKSENRNPNYLAWKTRDFIFDETPLNEVFRCLEKTYHVDINVADPQLNDLKLNAQFDKKPIEFILNVVGLTFNLELKVENEQYIFSNRLNN